MRKAGSSVTTSEVISQLRLPLIVLVTFAHSYGAVRSDFTLLSGNPTIILCSVESLAMGTTFTSMVTGMAKIPLTLAEKVFASM